MARFNLTAFRYDLEIISGRCVTMDDARAVRRDLQRHQTLAECACNGELSPRQQANARGVEDRLRAFFGPALAAFNGDPRGATVKLQKQTAFAYGRLHYFERDWGGQLIFTEYRR
jgi:hypothetical protein